MERFRAISAHARARFEDRDWPGMHQEARTRLALYTQSMERIKTALAEVLGQRMAERSLWAEIKAEYTKIGDKLNFELSRTFYNSVTRRVFSTVGVNPDIEFASLELAIDDWNPHTRILRRFEEPQDAATLLTRILEDYRFGVDYRDLARDVRIASARIERRLQQALGTTRIDAVELLRPVFYRSKAAYIMGRILCGEFGLPIVLTLLNSNDGVSLDAVLMSENDVSILFSFTRSYFHVDVECPREAVVMLKTIIPLKPVSELYSALGFNKHGKTELYRSLQRHLRRTSDLFEFATGDKGMVMLVFTLPSYDRVFKVIRDNFAFPKITTPRDVIERYRLVFKHDRVGRLVEAQRFKDLKIKMNRFRSELLDELLHEATHAVRREGEFLVFQHLYTERKVTPLNLYLRDAGPGRAAKQAVIDYGACDQGAGHGQHLPRGFPAEELRCDTRHGRVVFYDYDELCLVTDCSFRAAASVPRTPEDELASEPWFAAADNDVFPEEFRQFLGLSDKLLAVFDEQHGDLFTARFWRELQERHRAGEILDFFPYPEGERLAAEGRE